MFEYSQLSIGSRPIVLESFLSQHPEEPDEFIIDSRMAQLFTESTGSENSPLDQLKFLSKVEEKNLNINAFRRENRSATN